jgi:SAM-dependent methyltransferase
MTEIEHRIEASGVQPNYSGRVFTPGEVAKGVHRRFVGAPSDDAFESHGTKQLDYLVGQGLLPEHKLLDVGCGCFRAGRYFIDYLAPGNYYGVDANLSLMQIGYDVELTDEQRARLPVQNLRANDRFDVDFGTQFDFALAQSVFTHVSLNHIRLCLYRVSKVMRPGGSFFATFFEQPKSTEVDRILSPHKPKPLFTEKNAYWYYRADLKWAARIGPWKVNYIGDWGHPRNQKMMQFIRLSEEEVAERQTAAGGQLSLRQELSALVRRGRRWVSRRLTLSSRD